MQHQKVNVDTRTFVRFWLILLAIALAILLIWKGSSALLLLAISLFLALALNYPVSLISRKLPGRSRALAAGVAYIFVVLLLGLFIFAVIPPIVDQSVRFAKTVPGLIDNLGSQNGFLNTFINNYGLRGQFNDAIASLQSHVGQISATIGTNLLNGAGSFFSFLVNGLLVLIFTFFMLIEGPQWIDRLWSLYRDPVKLERHKKLSRELYGVVKGYVNGQITVAAIAAGFAALVTLALCLIFHIPLYLSLTVAAIIFLFELIPLFGATIGAVVAFVILVLNNWVAAIIFLAYYLIYQQIENAVISPKIQGNAVNISGLTVLASVTIGVAMFGILGGFIAIPIAGCIRILVLHRLSVNSQVREKRENSLGGRARTERLAKKA